MSGFGSFGRGMAGTMAGRGIAAAVSPMSFGLSLLPDLIGGLFGRSGQSSANKANLQIAREQMAFQERMSNTAYQRAADDLEAAGLNRILALGNPASSPGGASATMQNPNASMAGSLSRTAGTGIQVKMLNQQLRNMTEQEQNTSSDTYLKEQQERTQKAMEAEAKQRTSEAAARTRIANAQALMLEKEAGLYDHEYGTAIKGVEKWLGPVVGGAIGLRSLGKAFGNRPVTTEKSVFNRHGVYTGGSVTTRKN